MLRRNSVWSGGPENAFNTKKQLSSHIHQYHKNNKDCDKIYTNNTSYKKHMKSCAGSKTPVESFHCNDCDKTFSRNSHLTRHMRTHTGVKPDTQQCNQSIITWKIMLVMVLIHIY